MSSIFIISDLHLGDGGPRDNFAYDGNREESLCDFLKFVQKNNGRLIILGDLFEFWQANIGKVFVKYEKLLNRLASMDVSYILGNHDFDLFPLMGKSQFLKHPLFDKMIKPFEITIKSKRIYIMHGHELDGINSCDSPGWARIISIFAGIMEERHGSPMTEKGTLEEGLNNFGEWIFSLYKKYSRRPKSRNANKPSHLTPSQSPSITMQAINRYFEFRNNEVYDAIVVGHTHQAGKIADWYYNCGSWDKRSNDFIEIDEHGFIRIYYWTDKGAVENRTILPFIKM